jgi:peptidylprolyl isomerase
MPEKPEVDAPEGPPPTDLEVTDITVGDGTEAAPGDSVRVHYVGVAYSTGEEFDASYNRGAPLDFPLGAGRVIRGWDQGVVGMKVGGRRRLVIPPHLAYGDRGAGGVIAPGETLIFVVDLVDVRLSRTTPGGRPKTASSRSGAPASTTSKTSTSRSPATRSSRSPASPGPGSPRWRSGRSSRSRNGATWSRWPRTRDG